MDAGHVGRRRRPGNDLQARCAERLSAPPLRQCHAQRPFEHRGRPGQHRVRPLESAIVRVGSRNRHDPSHSGQRRHGSRLLRSWRAGPRQLHGRRNQAAAQPDAHSLQSGVAGKDRRLPVRSIPVFTGMLEFRAERSAGLGARRRAGRGRRRNPLVLFGVERPGHGRGVDLERPAGRREAQLGVVDRDRPRRRRSTRPACGANSRCRISSSVRRTSRGRG